MTVRWTRNISCSQSLPRFRHGGPVRRPPTHPVPFGHVPRWRPGRYRCWTLMIQRIHHDPHIRRRAAEALGRLQDEGALDSLVMALHDRDRIVQQAVIGALGAIGDPRAIPTAPAALSSAGRPAASGGDRGRAARNYRESGGRGSTGPDHDRRPARPHVQPAAGSESSPRRVSGPRSFHPAYRVDRGRSMSLPRRGGPPPACRELSVTALRWRRS